MGDIGGAAALYVRNMDGKVVFAATKTDALTLFVQEVLEEVSVNIGKPSDQLSLLAGARMLEPTEALQPLLGAEGVLELLVLVQKHVESSGKAGEQYEEQI